MDLSLFRAINDLGGLSRTADWAAVFLASYLQYALVAVFFGYLVWSRRDRVERKRLALVSLASVALSRGILTEAIRFFYHRPRPFVVLQSVTRLIDVGQGEYFGSFPSGHATFFFALAMAMYLHDKKWGWWFFAGAMLMGVARVFAGVHWPSDVLGGALIGVAAGWFADAMVMRWRRGWQDK